VFRLGSVVLERFKLSQSWYARVTLEEPQSAEPLREQFQGIRDLKWQGQLWIALIKSYTDADLAVVFEWNGQTIDRGLAIS
jgi:hypothetical protein